MKQFLESTNLLKTIDTEAAKTNEVASRLVVGLSEDQLNWKPAPGSWSIAQCLDHLAVSTEKFEPYMTAAIAYGRTKYPTQTPPAYRSTWLGGWLIKQMLPE